MVTPHAPTAAPGLGGLGWQARAVPRALVGVAGVGAARQALLGALLAMPAEHQQRLRVAVGPELALVLGPADDLPWVEGAEWLGHEPAAPSLLLPTAHDPSWPLDLLERKLVAARGVRSGAIAVLPRAGLLVATGPAAAPDPAALRAAAEAAAR